MDLTGVERLRLASAFFRVVWRECAHQLEDAEPLGEGREGDLGALEA